MCVCVCGSDIGLHCGTNGSGSCKNRLLLGEKLTNASGWMLQVRLVYSLEGRAHTHAHVLLPGGPDRLVQDSKQGDSWMVSPQELA